MHDEHSTPHSTEHAEKLGYEDSDVSLPVLLKWGFFLAVFVGATSLIVLLTYWGLVTQVTKRDLKEHAGVVRKVPAADVPQLQQDPVKDIQVFRREERARVEGYGDWKDGDGKEAKYIPIDQAMKLVADKGLPIQSEGSTQNDVTPPAVDRGFVDNPLQDQGGQPSVPGKVGPDNGDSMDESSYTRHTPGM